MINIEGVKMSLLKRSGLFIVSFLYLTGCATYPVEVQVPQGVNLVDFQSVQNNDNAYIGNTARWSGVIASIKNKASSTHLDGDLGV